MTIKCHWVQMLYISPLHPFHQRCFLSQVSQWDWTGISLMLQAWRMAGPLKSQKENKKGSLAPTKLVLAIWTSPQPISDSSQMLPGPSLTNLVKNLQPCLQILLWPRNPWESGLSNRLVHGRSWSILGPRQITPQNFVTTNYPPPQNFGSLKKVQQLWSLPVSL